MYLFIQIAPENTRFRGRIWLLPWFSLKLTSKFRDFWTQYQRASPLLASLYNNARRHAYFSCSRLVTRQWTNNTIYYHSVIKFVVVRGIELVWTSADFLLRRHCHLFCLLFVSKVMYFQLDRDQIAGLLLASLALTRRSSNRGRYMSFRLPGGCRGQLRVSWENENCSFRRFQPTQFAQSTTRWML